MSESPELTLGQVPLFSRLKDAHRILIAGCGGGFDVYCGVPLFLALRRLGKQVFLGNLTMSQPHVPGSEAITPQLTRIDETVEPQHDYFPEYHLACWLAEKGYPSSVYCFDRTGLEPYREAYQTLIDRLELDAVVVADGGTDCLMRGDESGLGTPHEDILTLATLHGLSLPRYLVSLGFGIDAFHRVCHAHFLENTAALAQEGAFLGTFSLLSQMPEGRDYIELVRYASKRQPQQPSIVNTSIASAVEGHYGDVHSTERTRGSELWINPLMSIYWCYELHPVAARVLYRDWLNGTQSFSQVIRIVEGARKTFEGKRPWKGIPI